MDFTGFKIPGMVSHLFQKLGASSSNPIKVNKVLEEDTSVEKTTEDVMWAVASRSSFITHLTNASCITLVSLNFFTYEMEIIKFTSYGELK